MRKPQPYILFGTIFVVTFFIWKGFFSFPSEAFLAIPSSSPEISSEVSPSPSPVSEKVFGVPVRLVIPQIDLDTTAESVGMDEQGRMDIPKDVMNVAWYNLGYKPGQVGNAVFAGHFDKPDGSPSVFYKLDTLKKGDTFEVYDKSGNKQLFEVTEKRVVETNEFPLQEVFGETDKVRVNLITCGGKWDKAKKEYSERTVIFSELKEI